MKLQHFTVHESAGSVADEDLYSARLAGQRVAEATRDQLDLWRIGGGRLLVEKIRREVLAATSIEVRQMTADVRGRWSGLVDLGPAWLVVEGDVWTDPPCWAAEVRAKSAHPTPPALVVNERGRGE